MNRGVSLRLAAIAGLAAGGLIAALAGDLPLVASVTGDTVGLGLLAAGLSAAAAAETADGDRRATLLLAVAGGCLLLTMHAARTAARYGAATLAVVAGAGALYRSLVADGRGVTDAEGGSSERPAAARRGHTWFRRSSYDPVSRTRRTFSARMSAHRSK